MATEIRFGHAGDRRAVVDARPRVALRVNRRNRIDDDGDDLRPARGVMIGTLLGITLWTAIFLAWFIWS